MRSAVLRVEYELWRNEEVTRERRNGWEWSHTPSIAQYTGVKNALSFGVMFPVCGRMLDILGSYILYPVPVRRRSFGVTIIKRTS